VLLAALALTLDPDAFFHQHNAAVAQVGNPSHLP
jgi:hypothetical protein